MPSSPPTPSVRVALWQRLLTLVRASITPPRHLQLKNEAYRQVRAFIGTLWLFLAMQLGSMVLYGLVYDYPHVPQRLLAATAGIIACAGGYILVYRGMWRAGVRLLFANQIFIGWAYAVFLGVGGQAPLYYLALMVAVCIFFMNLREWLMMSAGNLALIILYGVLTPDIPMMKVISEAFTFNLISYGVLFIARVYQNRTAYAYLRSLRLGELRLRTTIEASKDGFYLLQPICDRQGETLDFCVIEANRVACEQIKLPRKSLIGLYLRHNYLKDGLFEQYANVFRTGEQLSREFITEGRYYHQQVVQVVDGLVVINHDITHRKQYELDLVQRQNRLKSLVDSQSAYLVRTDHNGNYTYANKRFIQQFNMGKDDLIGTNSLAGIFEDDWDKTGQAVALCFKYPGRPIPVTIRKPLPDGRIVWTDWEFVGVQDDAGVVTEIQCVGLDATARVQAEEANLEAERLRIALSKQQELNDIKTRMMTRISHEFRTPLTIIRSSTNMLERYSDRLSPEKREEKLTNIYGEIQRLTRMLDDMGRILHGQEQTTFSPAPLDIRAFIETLIGRYKSQATNALRLMLFDCDARLGIVWVDETLLDVMLSNLISNALKYSEPDAPIYITVAQEDAHLVLIVRDVGVGILPDELDSIYDPFFRGTNFGEVPGMGLGLSLVKNAVAIHDGKISVASDVGAGTTFTIRLPLSLPR